MKSTARPEFRKRLERRLGDARRVAVVGIGDELSPRDRPGMVAARAIMDQQIPGVTVFLSGTVPESFTGPLRKFRPDHVIFLDAADTGAAPGTISIISPGRIATNLISTHVLPLSVVMRFVARDTGAAVTLLGIQPCGSARGITKNNATFHRHMEVLCDGLRDTIARNNRKSAPGLR